MRKSILSNLFSLRGVMTRDHFTMKGGSVMKVLIFPLLALFIFACAQTRYTHSTKGPDEFEHAKYQCEKIAKHQAQESGSPDDPSLIADKTDQCLKLSGWTPVK